MIQKKSLVFIQLPKHAAEFLLFQYRMWNWLYAHY